MSGQSEVPQFAGHEMSIVCPCVVYNVRVCNWRLSSLAVYFSFSFHFSHSPQTEIRNEQWSVHIKWWFRYFSSFPLIFRGTQIYTYISTLSSMCVCASVRAIVFHFLVALRTCILFWLSFGFVLMRHVLCKMDLAFHRARKTRRSIWRMRSEIGCKIKY